MAIKHKEIVVAIHAFAIHIKEKLNYPFRYKIANRDLKLIEPRIWFVLKLKYSKSIIEKLSKVKVHID